jgi:hypothetical protein
MGENEFKDYAILFTKILELELPTHEDGRTINQAEVIKAITKGDKGFIETLLHDVSIEAPIAFERLWPTVFKSVQPQVGSPAGAIDRLGLLLGWAYIETAWYGQESGRASLSFGGQYFATLAAIQMGLPPGLSEKGVITAIFSQSTLMSSLLLNRFERGVQGGLEQINGMESRIAGWESRLNGAEARVDESESKITAYEEMIKKYQIAMGFLGMAKAYREFFERKIREKEQFASGLVLICIGILLLPLIAISQISVIPQSELSWVLLAQHYLPAAALVFLLVYFFRVVLFHYNSTKAQLLQLELRMSAFGFIQEYVTFLKDNNSPDLSKFEGLVFGGIVADLNKVPSTFDGLDQLLKTIAQFKSEKE